MNLKRTYSILLCLFATIMMNAQTFKTPTDYLDFVGKEQKSITRNMWNYTKALAHSKSDRTIDSRRKILIKTVERAIAKITKAEGFDGNTYKNQVLKHLNFNLNLLKEDYAKIIDMKEVAEQSYDLMEAYMLAQEMADEKLEESQQQYETDFYAFANKHNINILESESDLGKKMTISNEVFKHYKEMYLKYFKVYINEVYLIDALNKGDVGAIEQSAAALSASAKEGLKLLENIELYKGDKSIINATKEAFNFFIDEADNKIPVITEFLVLNEDFETIKKAIESTPQRKRTKEQIAEYNQQVKKMNKGVKDYNKTNAELNKNRQIILNKLNGANERFLSKHIPKQ
ncbi:hypothetical protein EYD45_02030 [Hyunsoonleella flava]|uniref:Uncharacterized protein n=1 Tax=Hyunsoonleella flava TaxID=2527939 RepID=A0A4Q9FJ90_9FLAO|nr:hypothetical protein [Hyunsoonleella flava]TBN06685.1 hypothetical protein EYD45_02030 [Hyunsoonleella flava]